MILVTGGSGFVGSAVVREAVARGLAVRAAVRRMPDTPVASAEYVTGTDIAPGSNWRDALVGVDAIVHAAARVHMMSDPIRDPLAEFRRINVAGTEDLARQAAAAGVRRFVFISSIKVNGERSAPGRPIRATDDPAPVDPYGISKHEAELALHRVAADTGLDVVVVRPVLVYGPGAKANIAAMMRWLRRGVPLPFGAVHNARSLVAIANLVDLIITCLAHPAAPGQTFLVSDGDDMSTTELLRRMARAMDVAPRLVPVPAMLLRLAARTVGRADLAQRLLGSLQVDIGPTQELLGWTPPVHPEEGLRAAVHGMDRSRVGR